MSTSIIEETFQPNPGDPWRHHGDRRRRVHRHCRAIRLWLIHAPAHGGGAGKRAGGRNPHRGKRVSEPAQVAGGHLRLNEVKIGQFALHDGPLHLGIRPEHVRIADTGIPMQVHLDEPLGANTLLHGKLAGSDQAFTATIPGVYRLNGSAETVQLAFDESHLHAFDEQTGRRMSL